jgi:membrane-associated protease RseP (regulator of RpoE activity)
MRDALWIADQLHAKGYVDRAYLGVRLKPVLATDLTFPSKADKRAEASSVIQSSGTIANSAGVNPTGPQNTIGTTDEGAILDEVLADTPAAKAGLQPGDIIIELEGQPIRTPHDLTDRLERILARATITLSVVRDHGPRRKRIALSLCTASRTKTPLIPAPSAPPVLTTTASPTESSSTSSRFSGAQRETTIMPSSGKSEIQTPIPASLQPDDLRLTLPRAVAERIEKLERRLEKLESFPTSAAVSSPQISSSRGQ